MAQSSFSIRTEGCITVSSLRDRASRGVSCEGDISVLLNQGTFLLCVDTAEGLRLTVENAWFTLTGKRRGVAIRDPDIFRIIEKVGDHFLNNVSNRFIRKALVVLDLPQAEWDRLENLTNKTEYYKQNGFSYDELYEMVLAAAHFLSQARQKMVPNIKGMLAQAGTEKDKVLREMAAQNFPVNLAILSDLVNELYMRTREIDRAEHEKKRPVYERIPELKDIGKLLVNE